MYYILNTFRAWEKSTGEQHIIEVYKVEIDGAAPYSVFLDGAFYATGETRVKAMEEVNGIIDWFDWTQINPSFS